MKTTKTNLAILVFIILALSMYLWYYSLINGNVIFMINSIILLFATGFSLLFIISLESENVEIKAIDLFTILLLIIGFALGDTDIQILSALITTLGGGGHPFTYTTTQINNSAQLGQIGAVLLGIAIIIILIRLFKSNKNQSVIGESITEVAQ